MENYISAKLLYPVHVTKSFFYKVHDYQIALRVTHFFVSSNNKKDFVKGINNKDNFVLNGSLYLKRRTLMGLTIMLINLALQ
jgi:hypothetical protein